MHGELADAVEELYAVFARHPLAARISYCGHCVSDEEWHQVLSDSSSPFPVTAVLECISAHDHSVVAYLRQWEGITGPDADLQLASYATDTPVSPQRDGRYDLEVCAWLRSGHPERRLEAAFLAAADPQDARRFGLALEQLEYLLFQP